MHYTPTCLALGRATAPRLRLRGRRGAARASPGQAVRRFDHRPLTVIELTRLLGQRAMEQDQNPEILTAQALQRPTAGEGLLIHTHQPPTFYRQRRYYEDPTLKAMAA